MSTFDDTPRFERVDWNDVAGSTGPFTAERATFLAGVAIVLALVLYDTYLANVYLVAKWNPKPVDWVFLLSVVVLLAFGVVPAIRRREAVGRVLRRLRSRPATLLGAGYLSVLVVVGTFAPAFFEYPGIRFQHAFHPPIGFTSVVPPNDCLGQVTGDVFNQVCHGSLAYPLGTDVRGFPLEYLLASGARVAVYIVAFTAAFVVPLAIAVGVVAGVRGGWVDDLLMSYVDVQLCVPAMVLYLIGFMYWNPSLLLLLVTFGLLSWGGIARLVRSEVLQRREDGYVLVARSLGASRGYIARRHILPNSTNTVVPAVFHLLALLVLVEAGIAFLGFHEITVYSWGSTISESVSSTISSSMNYRSDYPAYQIWWASTFPAVALTTTMISFKLLGDGLRDALDPRREV